VIAGVRALSTVQLTICGMRSLFSATATMIHIGAKISCLDYDQRIFPGRAAHLLLIVTASQRAACTDTCDSMGRSPL